MAFDDLEIISKVMFTSDMPYWDPSMDNDECDDLGDLPNPLEDNFIYVDQGMTNTGDEIFFNSETKRDGSTLPID